MLTLEQGKKLIKLARGSIAAYFSKKDFKADKLIKDEFSFNAGVFVTLNVSGQLRGCIGFPEPVSLAVNTFDTGKVAEEKIEAAVREIFSVKPAHIIKYLNLRKPIYFQTASYGHFGRSDKEFSWEKTDKVDELKQVIKVRQVG